MGIFSVLIRLYENTFENASDRILRTQLYVYVIVMQKNPKQLLQEILCSGLKRFHGGLLRELQRLKS